MGEKKKGIMDDHNVSGKSDFIAGVATYCDENTRGRGGWGRDKEFTFGPLKFEVIMREPSEDVRCL